MYLKDGHKEYGINLGKHVQSIELVGMMVGTDTVARMACYYAAQFYDSNTMRCTGK